MNGSHLRFACNFYSPCMDLFLLFTFVERNFYVVNGRHEKESTFILDALMAYLQRLPFRLNCE